MFNFNLEILRKSPLLLLDPDCPRAKLFVLQIPSTVFSSFSPTLESCSWKNFPFCSLLKSLIAFSRKSFFSFPVIIIWISVSLIIDHWDLETWSVSPTREQLSEDSQQWSTLLEQCLWRRPLHTLYQARKPHGTCLKIFALNLITWSTDMRDLLCCECVWSGYYKLSFMQWEETVRKQQPVCVEINNFKELVLKSLSS